MWSNRQQELKKAGLDEKTAQQVQKEASKHKLLRNLKAVGGPFSSKEDVEDYMKTEKDEAKMQRRLKEELQ